MHRWAMKGVDEAVQATSTLCNSTGANTRNNAVVTCEACLALMRPLPSIFPGVKA